MSLKLPDFTGRRCLLAAFCGFMPTEKSDKSRSKLKAVDKALIAKYTKSGKDSYLRLTPPFPWASKVGGRVHVHFVVASADWFGKDIPQPNVGVDEILALITPLIGKEMDVRLTGEFRVPLTELPPFIRKTAVESTFGSLQLRMKAGTISIKGAPVQEISWELPTKGDLTNIKLELMSHIPIEEDYLDKGFDVLEAAFRAIIVGETKDAKPK